MLCFLLLFSFLLVRFEYTSSFSENPFENFLRLIKSLVELLLLVSLPVGDPGNSECIDLDLECFVVMRWGVCVVTERSSLIYCRNLVRGMTRSVSILNLLWVIFGGSTRCVCLDLKQWSSSS